MLSRYSPRLTPALALGLATAGPTLAQAQGYGPGMMGGSLKCGVPGSGGSAIDILKERFARGEIDKQEYEERKRTLQ